MTATTLQTELEAVNVLLASIDEAPVASLALSGLYPLTKAKETLSEASRVVQSMGWDFNTEEDYPLTRDGSNNITLPGNVLMFEQAASTTQVDAVARGLRIYNRTARSYVFPTDLKGKVVLLLPWDDIPQAVRHYITIRAARTLQGRMPVSESTYRYSQDDEQAALQAASAHEAETGRANFLTDSWSVGQHLRYRDY